MNDASVPAPGEPAPPRPGPDDRTPSSRPPGEVVTLTCRPGDADALSDLAWAHGATGVAELADEPGPGSVRLVIGAGDAGAAAHLVATIAADGRGAIESVMLADAAWSDTWRAHATAHRAGPFGIRLPDHGPTDAPIDIVIEPGATFGYGHPTTLLALESLATVGAPLGRVLDIGTGSGVLAIAASLLGADEVSAVDIDPDAVAACRANAGRNGVDVTVILADACTDPLAAQPVGYDVVLVNVTAAVQVALADVVASVAVPDATVVLSGILAYQASAVLAAYGPAVVTDRREGDGWVSFVLHRR